MAETVSTSPFPMMTRIAKDRETLAYRALVLFSYYYFIRPEDFIPGLAVIPLGKIMGGLALLALLVGPKSKAGQKVPPELKVLTLLLVQMLLTIPFASWRGGAFDSVVNKFSKGVIVAYLIVFTLNKVSDLRKLLLIQVGTVALITVASVIINKTQGDGRLMGIQKGILENPNDLAINIAINFPLALAFLIGEKGVLSKIFWAGSMAVMLKAVVATYSRSGMVALAFTLLICVWEFGLKGRRPMLLVTAVVVAVIGFGVMFGTPHYLARLESLAFGNIQGANDHGSLEGRKALLMASLRIMVEHPMFGVGPGNFAGFSGFWQPAHNTYTGLGAETGVPGLFLFVLLMALSLRKTAAVRKLPGYAEHANIRLWASGLRAGLGAYLVGAMFATTEYNLFPYFMVGYICALYRIAGVSDKATEAKPLTLTQWNPRDPQDAAKQNEPVRIR
jgi:putative inorganic carbon (hco3(-)) transporter